MSFFSESMIKKKHIYSNLYIRENMTTKNKSFITLAFVLVTLSMLAQSLATQMLNVTLSPFAS